MSSEMVTIKTYSNRLEAELAKSKLASFGIDAMVSADDAGGIYPTPFAYRAGVERIVREEDTQRAVDLLKELPTNETRDQMASKKSS